jgi:nicotinate-nucleotide adenylyltransferase
MQIKSKHCNSSFKIGLLGGSFNPLHVGHLRLCVEIMEKRSLDHVQLIPAHIPPHKDLKNILPFDIRCSMIESAIRDFPRIILNCLEKERPGPSYTYDTLQALIKDDSSSRFFFIMGSNDLLTMSKWYKGREIALLSDIIVAGREGLDVKTTDDFISGFWDVQKKAQGKWLVNQGKYIEYISIPRLDISSSVIRAGWLAGKSVDWLVPEGVKICLDLYRDEVQRIWKTSAG